MFGTELKNSLQIKSTLEIPSKTKTMLIPFINRKIIIHRKFGCILLKNYRRILSRRFEVSDVSEVSEFIVFNPNIEPDICSTNMHRVTPHLLFINFRLEIKSVYWIILRIQLIRSRKISPYSPKLKLKLKGYFFNYISTINKNTIRALKKISQNELEHVFELLLNRNRQVYWS